MPALKKLNRRLSRDQQGKRALKRLRRMAERAVNGAPPAGQHQDALAVLRMFGVSRDKDGRTVKTLNINQPVSIGKGGIKLLGVRPAPAPADPSTSPAALTPEEPK